MEKDGRHNGIDVLKIIATIFVVVLHVNGFLSDTIPLGQFSLSTNVLYHISEAVAYPAIHLFVMVTAYFTIEKGTNKKTIITIWSQTFIICIIGLVLAVILKVPFGIKELIRSLFPFSGRAYWYVSDYIVLMLIAPILNKLIRNISIKELRYLILVMFGIVSFGPAFLSFFGWNQNYSNIGLFIFLYFIVAGMKKDTNIFSRIKGGGDIVGYLCYVFSGNLDSALYFRKYRNFWMCWQRDVFLSVLESFCDNGSNWLI